MLLSFKTLEIKLLIFSGHLDSCSLTNLPANSQLLLHRHCLHLQIYGILFKHAVSLHSRHSELHRQDKPALLLCNRNRTTKVPSGCTGFIEDFKVSSQPHFESRSTFTQRTLLHLFIRLHKSVGTTDDIAHENLSRAHAHLQYIESYM